MHRKNNILPSEVVLTNHFLRLHLYVFSLVYLLSSEIPSTFHHKLLAQAIFWSVRHLCKKTHVRLVIFVDLFVMQSLSLFCLSQFDKYHRDFLFLCFDKCFLSGVLAFNRYEVLSQVWEKEILAYVHFEELKVPQSPYGSAGAVGHKLLE